MKSKINIGVLFGGQSVEHQISLLSAKNVIAALDRTKYTLTFIGIDKEGNWGLYEENTYLQFPDDPLQIALGEKVEPVYNLKALNLDVVFPVLHGTNGEDGTVQGFLKLLNLPFVGASVLGSAVGMDKDVMKRLFREAKLPHTNFLVVHKHMQSLCSYDKVVKELGPLLFVKPANSGSSVGVTKVHDAEEFAFAMQEAFRYDQKILVEEAIEGIEIQCGVLGNHHPIVSLPCAIIPKGELHSYESKYVDHDLAQYILPYPLAEKVLEEVQTLALKAFQVLCCEGTARVDLFLSKDGNILLNELNTIPGMTLKSPYFRMWEATGLSRVQVCDQLIELALERSRLERSCTTEFAMPCVARSTKAVGF